MVAILIRVKVFFWNYLSIFDRRVILIQGKVGLLNQSPVKLQVMNSLQKIRKTLLTAPEFEGRHPSQEHTGFFTPKRAKSVPNFALDLAGEDENGGVVPLPVIRDSDDDGGDRATCKCG